MPAFEVFPALFLGTFLESILVELVRDQMIMLIQLIFLPAFEVLPALFLGIFLKSILVAFPLQLRKV